MKEMAVLFSGIQPTGNLTIANYAGAIKNWLQFQNEYESVFALVDLHALTVRQHPCQLRERCYDFAALYLACGIDPNKSTIFVQSHVPTHAQLMWILNCVTYVGELRRMTQFKEKAVKHAKNMNAGLFDYPVLMAADILLYKTEIVPVGEDQKQHVELARDIAVRFNNHYGEVFRIPEHFIPAVGARIKSLQEPSQKMSKTDDNPRSYIALLDSPELVHEKIQKAVTGSSRDYADTKGNAGILNLLTVFSLVSGKSVDAVRLEYEGKGYSVFKRDLAEHTIEFLRPMQRESGRIRGETAELKRVLKAGSEKALSRSTQTLREVHKTIGLVPAA